MIFLFRQTSYEKKGKIGLFTVAEMVIYVVHL